MPVPGEAIGSFANWITERLATGGALSGPPDIEALAAAGITAVVDCRIEFNDGPLFAGASFQYLWAPTADDGTAKGVDWFGPALAFALPLFARPGQRVLAHCAAGVNRGPSMAYGVLRALGLTAGEAMLVLTTGRPQAQVRYAADADHAVTVLGYV